MCEGIVSAILNCQCCKLSFYNGKRYAKFVFRLARLFMRVGESITRGSTNQVSRAFFCGSRSTYSREQPCTILLPLGLAGENAAGSHLLMPKLFEVKGRSNPKLDRLLLARNTGTHVKNDPPSTSTHWPVTKSLLSLASQLTVPLTCSATLTRPKTALPATSCIKDPLSCPLMSPTSLSTSCHICVPTTPGA